jgi:DNA-binding SARP family transcriptional activator/streptogramin lyase
VFFRILGSLDVEDDEGRSIELGGRQQRLVLAMLLLHRNELVSVDRLIDALWGERPPPNAVKNVQIHISRLRKALEPHGTLRTHANGYALDVAPGELDVDRFERLLEDGRRTLAAGEPAQAEAALTAALALWRGPPLADFAYDSFAVGELARLDELHLAAIEEQIDARLALGRHDEMTPELHRLAAVHPLRERVRAQLMLALYRAGRKADALRVYDETRRLLAEELGLEPSESLRRLHSALLADEPALAAPPRVPPASPASQPQPPRVARAPRPLLGGRNRILLGAGGALVLGAALAVAVLAVTREDTTQALPPRSLAAIDPRTMRLTSVSSLASAAADVEVGRRAVFIALPTRQGVVVVDPRTRAQTVVGAAVRPTRLARSGRGLWLLEPRTRRVALLGSDRVYTVGEAPGRAGTAPLDALASGGGSVWLAERHAEIVFRLDPKTGRTYNVDNRGPDSFFEGGARRAMAIAAGSLWVSNPVSRFPATDRFGRVSRIDLRTGEVTARIRLPAPPRALAADADGVWVALERGSDLWRIDPRDDVAAAAVRISVPIADVATGEDAVWALSMDGTVSRIDATTNSVTGRISLGRGTVIAAGHGSVWVASR